MALHDELPPDALDALARGRCPQCACDDWILGPRGGAAQNFECNGCHHRYNITIWDGELIFAEHIGHRDGGTNWAEYAGPPCRLFGVTGRLGPVHGRNAHNGHK